MAYLQAESYVIIYDYVQNIWLPGWISVSHVSPVYPEGQLQVKITGVLLIQVPPFKHGLDTQASVKRVIRKGNVFKWVYVPCNRSYLGSERTPIDLMHDDVSRPEMQYGSCSHAQIQDGRQ